MPASRPFRPVERVARPVRNIAGAGVDIVQRAGTFFSKPLESEMNDLPGENGRALFVGVRNTIDKTQNPRLATTPKLADAARVALEEIQELTGFKTPHERHAMERLMLALEGQEQSRFPVSRLHEALENPEYYRGLDDVTRNLIDKIGGLYEMTGQILVDTPMSKADVVALKDFTDPTTGVSYKRGDLVRDAGFKGLVQEGRLFERGSRVTDTEGSRFLRMHAPLLTDMLASNGEAYRDFVQATIAGNIERPYARAELLQNKRVMSGVEKLVEGGLDPIEAENTMIAKFIAHEMEAMRLASIPQAGEPNNAKTQLAQEHSRRVPYMPSMMMNRHGTHSDLFVNNPRLYSERMYQSVVSKAAFYSEFGQGIDDTFVKDPTPILAEDGTPLTTIRLSSPDKWAKIRKDLIAETADGVPLVTGKQIETVDMTQRVLMGLPIDAIKIDPSTPLYDAYTGFKTINGVFKDAMLSASAFANMAESIVGDTGAFMGFGRQIRAWKRVAENKDFQKRIMDTLGAISPAFIDVTYNKNHPLLSLAKIFKQTSARVFLHHFLNESQEFMAAQTMHIAIDDILTGKSKRTDKAVIKQMEVLTDKELDTLFDMNADGETRVLLGEVVVRKAAQYFASSPMNKARESKFGNSQILNQLFPFTSYGRGKLHRLTGSIMAVKSAWDANSKGTDRYSAAMKAMRTPEAHLLGKSIATTTMQGAGANLLLSLAFGGTTGLSAAISEAKDEPIKFLVESFVYSAIVGPLGQLIRYSVSPDAPPSEVLGKSMFPAMMLDEVYSLANGKGIYRDQSGFERVGTFFTRRLPISGPAGTVLATVGLTSRDAGLEGSIRSYWKWRREVTGIPQSGKVVDEETDKVFRIHMRRAIEKMKADKDPRADINKAIGVDGKDAAAASRRILSKRLLFPFKKHPDKLNGLRKRIGEAAYDKLVRHDELLERWAKSVKEGR